MCASDRELLRAWREGGNEAAFSELVRRHLDVVYAVALRRCGGDAHLAQDVGQRVFVDLARKASTLASRESLAGWLYLAARNAAAMIIRTEQRRRNREEEAQAMQRLGSDPAPDWGRLRAVLDEALHDLREQEREAVLLRFYHRCELRAVGDHLGVSEEAARKRVERTLEKLRLVLIRRGVTTSAAVLAGALAGQAGTAAPVGLAATVLGGVIAGTSAFSSTTLTLLQFMATTKAKICLAAVLAAGLSTTLIIQHQSNGRLRAEVTRLQAALVQPADPAATGDASDLERLRREHEELMRLRGQVALLRAQLAHQPVASTNGAGGEGGTPDDRRAREIKDASALLAKFPEIPMITRNEFRNAGYATSFDAFHTINWAAATHDTNAMFNAIGLEPEARTRADELFSQLPEGIRQKYGSVDALLVDWRMNLAEAPEAYRVLSHREEGPDAATLTVQFQYPNSRVRENEVSFYRDANGGWRQAMPAGVMDKLPSVAATLNSSLSSSGK
ncbi:MAG: sigma-70 family RNA polymerase sigma factor [Verrucomicrobiota bacterium]